MDKKQLLKDIDLAMQANNQAPDIAFNPKYCQCDTEVGYCPCTYCAIHDALRRSKEFIQSLSAFSDPFYQEGYNDFEAGIDFSECPYEEGTDGQFGWKKGWWGAEFDAELEATIPFP